MKAGSKAEARRKKQKEALRASMAASEQAIRRKRVTVDPAPWDLGAEGQANRRGLVTETRKGIDPETDMPTSEKIKGARRRDLLEFWLNRGTLDTRQFNAGNALRLSYEQTFRSGGACLPENDRVQSSPKPDHAIDMQIKRISQYHEVRKLVADADWPVIQACVLDGAHPSRIYGPFELQKGFQELREALSRLADRMEGR